jgi:hypothetical protein
MTSAARQTPIASAAAPKAEAKVAGAAAMPAKETARATAA